MTLFSVSNREITRMPASMVQLVRTSSITIIREGVTGFYAPRRRVISLYLSAMHRGTWQPRLRVS